MSGIFNKSLLKFFLGFISIIAASFLILITIGYYESEVLGNKNVAPPRLIQASGETK